MTITIILSISITFSLTII